jgi:ABC-2 type transport system permease protein
MTTYLRYELLRAFRSRRFLFLSFAFPLVLYVVVALPNRHTHDLGGTGLSAPLYFMVGYAAFGTMNAMLGAGGRIAGERQAGWTRQLRLTPLSPRTYFRAKVLTSYAMALGTLLLLYVAGSALGVRLSAGEWVHMTWLIVLGLVPFAALGILVGHLVTVDSVGPATGGSVALLSIFGGVWFPVQHGALHALATLLPSYWLVQAGRVAEGGQGWTSTGFLVVAAWAVGLAAAARWAYRRDTGRA